MIAWSNRITVGTKIEQVKQSQPEYIKIDWQHPDTLENVVRYSITEIEGNDDFLKMDYYLEFVDNKYQARGAHK